MKTRIYAAPAVKEIVKPCIYTAQGLTKKNGAYFLELRCQHEVIPAVQASHGDHVV